MQNYSTNAEITAKVHNQLWNLGFGHYEKSFKNIECPIYNLHDNSESNKLSIDITDRSLTLTSPLRNIINYCNAHICFYAVRHQHCMIIYIKITYRLHSTIFSKEIDSVYLSIDNGSTWQITAFDDLLD